MRGGFAVIVRFCRLFVSSDPSDTMPVLGSTGFVGGEGTAIDLISPPVLGLRLPAGKPITEDGLPAR